METGRSGVPTSSGGVGGSGTDGTATAGVEIGVPGTETLGTVTAGVVGTETLGTVTAGGAVGGVGSV